LRVERRTKDALIIRGFEFYIGGFQCDPYYYQSVGTFSFIKHRGKLALCCCDARRVIFFIDTPTNYRIFKYLRHRK